MSESYEVVADALNRHARTLLDLAGELRAALESAGAVSMTGNAYGQTGARFAGVANELAAEGKETLRAGVDALDAAGTTLRATAAAYERQDASGAEQLAAAGGGLS